MSIPMIGITILWMYLFGYLILASVDFGAGFYAYYAKWRKKDIKLVKLTNRYLSPIWEVTNILFVFFFVGIIGLFPDTAYYYGTSLLIPGSFAFILLAIRGSFYAFENYGSKQNRIYMFLYGATGLLIPATLSIALSISEGGYISKQDHTVVLLADKLATSSYSWSVILLAIVSVLYISASFLTYYADRAGDEESVNVMRKFSLFWAIPAILASIFVFLSIRTHNAEHFQHMMQPGILGMFCLSFACFLGATHFLFHRNRYGLAFLFVIFQYLFAFFGYGAGHLPYILYPYITISSGYTNEAMGMALVIAFGLGILLLIPTLYLLLRVFLFDAKYIKEEK